MIDSLFDRAERYRRFSAKQRIRQRHKGNEHQDLMDAALARDSHSGHPGPNHRSDRTATGHASIDRTGLQKKALRLATAFVGSAKRRAFSLTGLALGQT
jgi:hypothetical protein